MKLVYWMHSRFSYLNILNKNNPILLPPITTFFLCQKVVKIISQLLLKNFYRKGEYLVKSLNFDIKHLVFSVYFLFLKKIWIIFSRKTKLPFPKQDQRNLIKIILMQFHRLNCHPYSISLRVTIHAGRNQRKSNSLKAFFFCKIQRVFITGSKKCLCFRWSIFKINRPNSVDHKTGRL